MDEGVAHGVANTARVAWMAGGALIMLLVMAAASIVSRVVTHDTSKACSPDGRVLYHSRAGTARAAGPSCRPHLGICRSARSVRHALPHSVPAPRWPHRGDVPVRVCRVTRNGRHADHIPGRGLLTT